MLGGYMEPDRIHRHVFESLINIVSDMQQLHSLYLALNHKMSGACKGSILLIQPIRARGANIVCWLCITVGITQASW